MKTYFFYFLLTTSVHATVPLDIVFDIDQTIVTLVHDGPRGDTLADPVNPGKGIVRVDFDKPKFTDDNKYVLDAKGHPVRTPASEKYRVYDGVSDLMERLAKLQKEGKIRISFYSGGSDTRNKAVLDTIKLKDGTPLSKLSEGRIYDRTHMAKTGKGPEARIRERFKKDLTIINNNLEDVILVDDIKNFVPESQAGHVLYLGEDYPYPERVYEVDKINPGPQMIKAEKNKMEWLSEYLLGSIDRRFKDGVPLARVVQEATDNGNKTPFTPGEEIHFTKGRKRLNEICWPLFDTLNHLLTL